MSPLKMITAGDLRSQGPWPDDDQDVVLVDTGKTVERISRRNNSRGTGLERFRGLGFGHKRGAPFDGTADSEWWRQYRV